MPARYGPELMALVDCWFSDDEEAVRARIASMTRDEVEEVVDDAVHELMLALVREYKVEKVLGTLD